MPAPHFVHLRLHSEFSIVDGTVRIDWDVVETLAASKADQTLLPIAQLTQARPVDHRLTARCR